MRHLVGWVSLAVCMYGLNAGECILYPSFSADPPMCTFPFQFGKKYIYECTKEGYILNRSWCSLTDNYNKDKKWKQCSPYK
nr:binder of sperm protein homolog 2-like [Peromyscus maniculatus bairdii]